MDMTSLKRTLSRCERRWLSALPSSNVKSPLWRVAARASAC